MEQNKRSFDGVTRRFELECCTFLRRQRKYSARIWSCNPSNLSKFNAEYEYQLKNLNLIEYVMAGPTEIERHGYLLSGGGHMNFLNRGKAGPEKKHMGPFL